MRSRPALAIASMLTLAACGGAAARPPAARPGPPPGPAPKPGPAPAPLELALWPGAVPDAVPTDGPERGETVTDEPVAGKPWTMIGEVSRPTITVYRPAGPSTGAAVVVLPGGGYWILAIDLEGTEVCDWLTSRGITCVLLKYRVPGHDRQPRSGAYPNSPAALEDGQRALGLVRQHAAAWGIDPSKVGVLGFSAGGHLAAALSTNFAKRIYPPVDAADALSCRPDFAVVLYPGHLLEHTSHDLELNPYVPVTADTSPTFLLQAEDDPVDPIDNSLVYFAALERAHVPVELHVYPHGGHAFGLRPTGEPITHWPALVEGWLRTMKILPP
ncbi:MAG TPA: alpha/beta hydrolase [Kofleriaceae bacterium]|nr:alpha/beta hydrolase [Kofleriaceae bacterium]